MTIAKQTLSISAGLLALAALTHPAFAQTVFSTGTTIYDPAEAYSSYVLMSDHSAVSNHPSARFRAESAGGSPGDIRLIDMNGNVVHTWEVAPYFNKRSRLLPSGNLVYNTYIAEDNTGRLFQVRPDGEIVWEYVNRGGTTRPSVIPYDFTPQLRALPRPEELTVTPPNNLEWHIAPDIRRENGAFRPPNEP